MSVSLALPCLGLAPDQHAIAAPKGAMRHAEHVVCDLPGIVRARPSFDLGTQKTATYVPTAMRVFGATRIVVSKDGATFRLESEAATITGNAEPVDFDARETSFAEARKSLYYCTSTGVRALRTEAGTTTDEAGMEFQHLLSPQRDNATGGAFVRDTSLYGPFTEPFSVAYVMCVKRTDANGYVKRSPPTNRFYLRRSPGGAITDAVVMLAGPSSAGTACCFPTGTLIAGDVVEFYRTTTGAAQYSTLSSDVYLVSTYTITAADVAAGYFPPSQVQIVDRVPDTDLGEALYTNPQREGALAAKYGPPIAQELALWQSCMWYGRTKSKHRLELTLVNAGDESGGGSAAMTTESVGTLNTTGDFAIGTNTILNVASVVGLAVGAYVGLNGANPFTTPAAGVVPVGTKVTAIAGAGPYTVTMSANATGNSVGASIWFGDVLTVNGVDFVAWPAFLQTPLTDARRTFLLSALSAMSTRVDVAATNLARAINDYAVLASGTVVAQTIPGGLGDVGSVGNSGTLILERTTLAGSSFTVKSTKPQAWRPAIGDTVDDTLTSTQDDKPHRVWFSQPDEPEAVPLLNYIDIGSEKGAIQRLIPLADALLVFKEDGLYRITGSAPDRWTVTLLDPTLRLVRPEACAVLDDTVYAWTNRGVVTADESGVRQVISAGKIDTELFTAQSAVLGDDEYHGCRILTSQRHGLVLLTLPNVAVESPGPLSSSTVYCFAAKTGQWTKWPMYIRCGDAGSDGVLWIAANNSLNELEWETRYLRDTARGYDRNYTVGAGSGAPSAWTQTASSTAMSITNAQRGEWVPTVGDWVFWTIGSVYWRRIIAVSDDGGGDYSWTLDAAAPADIGTATDKGAVVGSPVLLEWLPSVGSNGGVMLPVWRGLTFTIDGEATAKVSPTDFRVTLGVRHDGGASVATVTGTPDRSTVQIRPYRMGWPRNGSRRPDVGPRLSWSEIDWPWRLSGVALIGEGGSERVRQ